MTYVPFARCWVLAVVLSALAFAVGAVFVDADVAVRRRRESDAAQDAIVRATGIPDLCLSSSARWLRHPSQAEASAALSDVPAGLDTEPAGAIIGPPRAILRPPGDAPR